MINFNELLAKDLADYLYTNWEWFIELDQEMPLDQQSLQEAISSYFKQHEDPVPALLRKK